MIENFKSNYSKLLSGYIYKTSKENIGSIESLESKILSESVKLEDYITKFDIIQSGSPVIENAKTIYAGRAVLTNNTNKEQKLKTDSFVHQESYTTTTKVVNGFNINASTTTKLNFDVLFGGIETNISVSAGYNFSKENTNTSTITKTITIPSQEILVPANTSVEVIAYFTKGIAKGLTTLEATLEGTDFVGYTFKDKSDNQIYASNQSLQIGEAVKYNIINPSELYFDYADNPIRLIVKGTGEFSCDFSNQYKVSVTPITNTRISTESQVMDIMPIIK